MPDDGRTIEETPPIGEAQSDPVEGGCPMVIKPPVEGGSNRDWWPNAVNLKILQKNPDVIDPMDDGYDYRQRVQNLDVDALTRRQMSESVGLIPSQCAYDLTVLAQSQRDVSPFRAE